AHLVDQAVQEARGEAAPLVLGDTRISVINLCPPDDAVAGAVEVDGYEDLGAESIRPIDAGLDALGLVFDRLAGGTDAAVAGEVVGRKLKAASLFAKPAGETNGRAFSLEELLKA